MIKTRWLMPLIKDPPTKTFEVRKDGTWVKTKGYPMMKHYRGIIQEVDNIEDFGKILKQVTTKSAFMIHGDFIPGTDLNKMVRRSRSDKGDPSICDSMLELFAIDIDGFPLLDMKKIGEDLDIEYDLVEIGKETIDHFVKTCLPEEFSNASYVYQFSSSFGLTSNNLKAHLYFTPEEPIHNVALRKWASAWNTTHKENLVDPAIYRAAQPLYTRHRICTISAGHPEFDNLNYNADPIDIDDMIGYVQGSNYLLYWQPSKIETLKVKDNEVGNLVNLQQPEAFDLSSSIRKIMTSENFHEPLRSTALSLLNKNVSPKDTKSFLEEFMRVAKQGIKDDPERLIDWQLRYDDIQRAIDSAIEIVNTPTFDDILDWITNSSIEEIKKDFASKLINFEGTELKGLAREVDERIEFGLRAISEDIKIAKAESKAELAKIARAIKTEERKSNGVFEIEITNSTYGEATINVCKVLSKSEKTPKVFKLGNTLSVIDYSIPKTIRQITRKKALKEDYPTMPVVRSIDGPVGVIRARVEKDCVFINETGKEIVCPESILNAVPKMASIDWRPLAGIVEHPFIDDNWNLVEKSGYDESTGLFAELHHKLKIKLTTPKKAYKYLTEEVLAEFPFQTKLDQATAVGMLMTAIQRPYVTGDNGMPGYAIVSPKPSSGKTTLAQLLSYSIYNRPVAATGWSDNDEELGKHLLAILREGHSCVLFDNIKKDAAIQSNELAKAMTSGTYSRRKLGVNETEEVPSSVLWVFTGNNIVFKGDFATRILPIRIVPNMERPESRKFNRQDIGQWAMDNRKKIISAILSIIMAGKDVDEEKYKSSARFKEWNRFVRIPLMEVSSEDLLDVFSQNDFMDDEAIAKGELLELLRKTFGDNLFKTRDIMDLVDGMAITGTKVALDTNGSEFKHTITEAFNEKATVNIKTLGRYILGMKDFILRGLMLVRAESKPMAKWRVVEIEEEQLELN